MNAVVFGVDPGLEATVAAADTASDPRDRGGVKAIRDCTSKPIEE